MVERVNIDRMDLGDLMTEEEVEAAYEGGSNLIPDQDEESPVYQVETPNVDDASGLEIGDDGVMLLNIKYPNQAFAINDDGVYSGEMAYFQDGLLITDRDRANRIMAIASYVYEEPKSGKVFSHRESAFKTRNAEAWNDYLSQYYDNRVV